MDSMPYNLAPNGRRLKRPPLVFPTYSGEPITYPLIVGSPLRHEIVPLDVFRFQCTKCPVRYAFFCTHIRCRFNHCSDCGKQYYRGRRHTKLCKPCLKFNKKERNEWDYSRATESPSARDQHNKRKNDKAVARKDKYKEQINRKRYGY